MSFSEIVLIVQLVVAFIQIAVIIWIAKQWRDQKKEERYSDQCHFILKSWPTINGYWKILTGQAVYPVTKQRHHIERFFSKNEDDISRLSSFLSYPEIYICSKDEESIKKVRCMDNDYNDVLNAFYLWLEEEQSANLGSLVKHLEKEYYEFDCIDEKDCNKITSIKNGSENELVKRHKVYLVHLGRYNRHIRNIFDVLKIYAHYQKKID